MSKMFGTVWYNYHFLRPNSNASFETTAISRVVYWSSKQPLRIFFANVFINLPFKYMSNHIISNQ